MHDMDPLTMGLISGGASLLGSIFSSDTSAKNTQAQIQASQQQQATQNAFTEQMSNTAYQRASADMKAAGLNPMMMFGSGSAASTPSGSSIQAPMPQTRSPLGDLGETVSRAVSASVQAKTLEEMSSRIAKQAADTNLAQATQGNVEQRTETEKASTDIETSNALKARYGLDTALLDQRQAQSLLRFQNNHPEVFDKLMQGAFGAKKVDDMIAPLVSGAGAVSRLRVDRGWLKKLDRQYPDN